MLKRASACCLALALGGCTGSLFQSKQAPPAIYLLSASAPASPADTGAAPSAAVAQPVGVDLVILKPRVRAGLDTDHVAVLYPDRRLDFFAAARWSGPLDEVMQDLAVESFDAGHRVRQVSDDSSAFNSGYWLEMTVVDFQAQYASPGQPPVVHVRITALLGTAAERRIVGRFDAQAAATATEDRLTAIVDAYERAANSVLQQLEQQTVAALRGSVGR